MPFAHPATAPRLHKSPCFPSQNHEQDCEHLKHLQDAMAPRGLALPMQLLLAYLLVSAALSSSTCHARMLRGTTASAQGAIPGQSNPYNLGGAWGSWAASSGSSSSSSGSSGSSSGWGTSSAQAASAAAGRRDRCGCANTWAPVCGSDGRTYGNRCRANCARAKVTGVPDKNNFC